jgi:hypothetical protein
MNMQRMILMVVCVFLMISPILAQAQEVPDQLGVAGFLLSGEPIQGEFSEEDGMQVFAFEGLAGDFVTLNMVANDDSTDPFLVVASASGQFLGYNDDNNGTLNAALSVELPEDGLYFALATSIRSLFLPESLEGAYSIWQEGATPSGNAVEDLLQAMVVPEFDFDSAEFVSLSEEMPIFFALFTVQDSVTLSVTAFSGDLDTVLYIFNPSGKRIVMDDDSGGGGSAAAYSLWLDEPGKYLVMITSRDFLEVVPEGGFEFGISRD